MTNVPSVPGGVPHGPMTVGELEPGGIAQVPDAGVPILGPGAKRLLEKLRAERQTETRRYAVLEFADASAYDAFALAHPRECGTVRGRADCGETGFRLCSIALKNPTDELDFYEAALNLTLGYLTLNLLDRLTDDLSRHSESGLSGEHRDRLLKLISEE